MERATSEREAERLGSGQTDPDKREVNEVHMDVLIKLPASMRESGRKIHKITNYWPMKPHQPPKLARC